jgi:subtilisin family serine protease
MSDLKEYVVTLHNRDDLEEFYKDMEILRPTPYNCMPERAVDCHLRRPTSRNTHYWMTEAEAEVLRQDPRVRAVMLRPEELGMKVRPSWTQTSTNWNKSNSTISAHRNWGLLRVVEGSQRSGWGSDGTPSQTATITINEEGRNVDVIIVDGHINPAHPEFAVNPDGTGGSRVIQLDWNDLTDFVSLTDDDAGSLLSGPYMYTPYTGGADEGDNNHGCHVAGTVVGNTQGWARSANIYNISPYSTNPNELDELVLFDYIRGFHANKFANLETGRRNPTICNHSWGYGYEFNLSTNPVLSINFRGSVINGPFTEEQLRSYGLFATGGFFYAPAEYPALDADMEDAIADGIIMVAAASNDYTKVDVPGGQDYNNFFTINLGSAFYNRGSSPGKAEGVICVGSIDILSTEYKADYSNNGPRVDIWAPGTRIISSTNSGGISDPRGVAFLNKYSGTSMASPQVCGLLACIMETYPNLTQAEALDYVKKYAKLGQLTDTGGGLNDYTSLQGAPNLYLAYNKERKTEGNVFPKLNYKTRPTSGAVYPRVRRG